MMNSKKKLTIQYAVLTFLAFIIANSGCNGKGSSGGFGEITIPSVSSDPTSSDPTSSDPTSSDPTSSDGSDLIVEGDAGADYFWVGYFTPPASSDDSLMAKLHTSVSFDQTCAVASSDTSNQDIVCMMEMPEGEVTVRDLEFKYNVPKNMCRFFRRSTYYYYNHETGYGPTSMTVTTNYTKNMSTDGTTVVSATLTSLGCNIDGASYPGCTNIPDVAVTHNFDTQTGLADIELKCAYDNSALEDGENCCLGKYEASHVINEATFSETSTTTESGKWDGDIKKCMAGPGYDSDWGGGFGSSGLPSRIIEYSEAGTSGTYAIQSPLTVYKSTAYSFPVANYFSNTSHTHDAFGSAASSTMPYFLDPIDDRSGDTMYSGNQAYTWECLDAALEVKHRIRLYIRDWDTLPDYLAYIASSGTVINPDRGSNTSPSTNCTGVAGYACNASRDLDDFINLILGGPYTTTASPAGRALRYDYFPYIIKDEYTP